MVDVEGAHNLVPVRGEDWRHQCCRVGDDAGVCVQTVGTFGVGSAADDWERAAGALSRLTQHVVSTRAFFWLYVMAELLGNTSPRRNYHQQMTVTYTVCCQLLKRTAIGTIAAVAVDLPSIIWCPSVAALESPSRWTPSSARPSVPSGTRVPQSDVGRVEICARQRPPRHGRCLANRVLPVIASFALAPLLVASAPSPILSFMNWFFFELHRRSQCRRILLSKLGGRISDMLWSCLTSWSRPIDIKLVELISGTKSAKLHVSAGPRWWFLVYRHRIFLDTLVVALRRRLALAPL